MRYRDQEDDELERMRSRKGRASSRGAQSSRQPAYGESSRRRGYQEEPEDSYGDGFDDEYEEEYDDGQWYDEDYDDGFGDDDLEEIYIGDRPGRRSSGRGRSATGSAGRSAGSTGSGRRAASARSAGPGSSKSRPSQRNGNGRGAQRKGGGAAPSPEARQRQQARLKKKKRGRFVRNILLLILAACLGSTAWAFFHRQTGTWTVAVFGVDSRDGSVEKNALADVQMICTVDRDTGDIKLVSVYRDTYLKINSKGTYHKINEAYFKGGHKQAVSALEENLDLKIDNYATFNWKSVVDAINILGGVDLEITGPEFKYINAFITETVNSTGIGSHQLESAGMNHLDGVQAVAYSRLRLMDTDYQRTERQRKVVSLALEKAKQADAKTLTNLVMAVLPQLSTDIGVNDVLPMAKNVSKYHLGETGGFPFSRQAKKIGKMDCVIPTTLESNVVQLHQFLFGTEGYKVSSAVKKISQRISEESGLYEEGKPAPTGGSGSAGGQSSGKNQAPAPTEPQTAPPETTVPETTAEETTVEETTAAESTDEADETQTQEIGPGVTPTTEARETTSAANEESSQQGNLTVPTEQPANPPSPSAESSAPAAPGQAAGNSQDAPSPAAGSSQAAPGQTPGSSRETPRSSDGPGGNGVSASKHDVVISN